MTEDRATFILRLWRERSAPPGEWRSEVEHVQGASTARFAELPAAFLHIRMLLIRTEQDGSAAHAGDSHPDDA
jgi:hypothetical protein